MSFRFKCIGETGTDCITPYELVFDKPMTVSEFVLKVLERNEWGCIEIYGPEKSSSIRREYKKDELIGRFPKEIRSKTIDSGKAFGGWSMMDYVLKLRRE